MQRQNSNRRRRRRRVRNAAETNKREMIVRAKLTMKKRKPMTHRSWEQIKSDREAKRKSKEQNLGNQNHREHQTLKETLNGEPGPNYKEIRKSWMSFETMAGINSWGNEGLS